MLTTKHGMASNTLVPGARHAVPPAGIATTAWPRIENTCANIGWRFDPWQKAVGRLILAKRADGGWAADLSLLSIPRQVGKSYLLGCIIFALCLLMPKLRVIWTSHHTATTEEMYESMKDLASQKRVAPHIKKCVALQGSRWRITFANGSRIDYGARERGFGRGKAKVGVLVLDEFQHISMRALSNLSPTTNTADNPLILCAGTPPAPGDNGEAFTMRRKAAIEGISQDSVYVEFSADDDADLDDRAQWAKANPSFPKRTPERAFLLNRKILDESSFKREFLGIWQQVAAHEAVIPAALWGSLEADGPSDGVAPTAIAVDASHDGIPVVAGCWRVDEQSHVELIHVGDVGDEALADWIAAKATPKIPVVIDGASPAARLVPLLETRRVNVVTGSSMAMSKACGSLFAAALAGSVTWGGLHGYVIGRALASAKKRKIGDAGGWGWDRRDPDSVISPLVAVTLAHYGASNTKKRTGTGRANGDRRAVSV